MNPVYLRDPSGGPPLELRACWRIWWALEGAHGNIGRCYEEHCRGHVRLRFVADLIYQCAAFAGAEITHAEVCERIMRLGLFEVQDVGVALFRDLMRPVDADDALTEPVAGEGKPDPFAMEGSPPSAPTSSETAP